MADADDGAGVEKNGLMAIELDESLSAACGEERRKDLRQAVDDLLEENSFALEGKQAENGSGPFILRLALIENRLIFSVLDQHGRGIAAHILSLSPLRRAIQDYNLICGSYSESVHSLPAERLEAIDMTRRAKTQGTQLDIDDIPEAATVDGTQIVETNLMLKSAQQAMNHLPADQR